MSSSPYDVFLTGTVFLDDVLPAGSPRTVRRASATLARRSDA